MFTYFLWNRIFTRSDSIIVLLSKELRKSRYVDTFKKLLNTLRFFPFDVLAFRLKRQNEMPLPEPHPPPPSPPPPHNNSPPHHHTSHPRRPALRRHRSPPR
ncbi:hypothetical protein XPA_009234 [Xanthoria parietina]